MDCSPPGSSVHGILQAKILGWVFPPPGDLPNPGIKPRSPALQMDSVYQLSNQGNPRILEWVAYPFCSGSSQPRNRTQVSCIAGRFFTDWAMREAPGLYMCVSLIIEVFMEVVYFLVWEMKPWKIRKNNFSRSLYEHWSNVTTAEISYVSYMWISLRRKRIKSLCKEK